MPKSPDSGDGADPTGPHSEGAPTFRYLRIQAQPDDTTCGPTCLQAVYQHLGDPLALEAVIREVPALDEGGTLAVNLATHALGRGYHTNLYTCNLRVFDPSWFDLPRPALLERLEALAQTRTDPKLLGAIHSYSDYLRAGGKLSFRDLSPRLLRHHLSQGRPILTGLSATWLYQSPREITDPTSLQMVDDDLHGDPQGHFVVLCGYDSAQRTVDVADPLHLNPLAQSAHYQVPMERLVSAIHLGVLTYDGNLLVIQGRAKSASSSPPERDQ